MPAPQPHQSAPPYPTQHTARRRKRDLAPVLASALLASALLASSCQLRPRSSTPPQPELRTIFLSHALPESPEHVVFSGPDVQHATLLARISAMASAPQTKGLFLQVDEMGGAFARASDLGDALVDFRKTHKPVHCHFENTDNVGYALLARSCDRISMSPAGTLNLVGVSLTTAYARSLLSKLGLTAELIQAGRYKGAADPLTRDDMPPEVHQTLDRVVDDLQTSLIAAIAEGRALPGERVRALIDAGPFSADDARAAGLVDDVWFDDAARAQAKTAAHAQHVVEEFPPKPREPRGLFDLLSAIWSSTEPPPPQGPRLGLAYLDGTILRGNAGSNRSAQAEPFIRAMREFASQPEIRAVVLRIDSPGGSALASDLMWHAVRRVAKHKPVIVSLGDMCASGGYYVASAGTEIMAQDQSLVGSIGVVGGKLVVQELASRIGVHVEQLARGKHAGWESPARLFSSGERAALEHSIQGSYDRFVARIAEGRNLRAEEIAPYAEGRLMTARRARDGHLVDRVGGLQAALATARERGKLGESAPIQVWPSKPTAVQALSELLDGNQEGEASLRGWHSALSTVLPNERAAHGLIETLLAGEASQAAVVPFLLDVR